jgi:phospholipase C
MHAWGERTQLEVGNRGLEVMTAMRQRVRLLTFGLIDLMVGPECRKHSGQPRHVPLAPHAAAIDLDVVWRTQENQQRFARRVRVGNRDACHNGGERGRVAAAQNVQQDGVELPGVLLREFEQPFLERHQHRLEHIGPAVCDAWFSSVPEPTWPNRFFMHAASSGGLDDSPSGLGSAGNSLFDSYTFNNGTIFDRLDDACLEWRVFAGDSFPVTLALSGMTLNELQGRIHDFDDFAAAVGDVNYSAAYTFIEPSYGNDLPPTAEDFTCGNSQHPLGDITRGERLIKTVYETIRNSPNWNESMLLVTYDEHGGFYDHVAPPPVTAPGDGVSDEDNVFHHFRFDQLGVRVPAVVISPFVERNVIDGTIYDHSSLLATVEQIFGLQPITARDATAATLMKLFTRSAPRTDAPTDVGQPAVSGFVCDDDLSSADGIGRAPKSDHGSDGGARRQDYDRMRDTEPVSPALRGFQEIALLKALKNARGRDRIQIRREYFAASTKGGARFFIRKVAQMTRNNRMPVMRRAWSDILSLFRLPPTRPWTADSIAGYRRR